MQPALSVLKNTLREIKCVPLGIKSVEYEANRMQPALSVLNIYILDEKCTETFIHVPQSLIQ